MDDLAEGFHPSLEFLTVRHEAVARYRVILSEGRGDRRRTQVDSNLRLGAARSACERLTAELAIAKPEEATGFLRSIYLVELENPEDCLTPYAKARLLLVSSGRRGSALAN